MPRILRLGVHTLSHFAVDFSCLFLLFGAFSASVTTEQSLILGFLLYNVLAFGLQFLLGALRDRLPRLPLASFGCALTLCALLLSPSARNAFPLAPVLVCALGNACFHVGGGADTLLSANGRMADGGVFVSSGSLGVLLGTLAGKSGVNVSLPAALMVLCLLLSLSIRPCAGEARFRAANERRSFPVLLTLLLSAVLLRSMVGFLVPMPWKSEPCYLLLPACAAFLGKASGGFLADQFGARRVCFVSLFGAALLLVFLNRAPYLCALGILLFNIPMPITLCALCDLFPRNTGLAFGLSTLMLLLGFLPTLCLDLEAAATLPLNACLTAAALICLLLATRRLDLSPTIKTIGEKT